MRILRYLFGPELIWIAACILASMFRQLNHVRQGQYNQLIESTATFLPVVVIALTMALYLIPWVPRPYLLLRIILTAIIGTNFLMSQVLSAHTTGGPGVGTIYLVAYVLVCIAVPVAVVLKYVLIKS